MDICGKKLTEVKRIRYRVNGSSVIHRLISGIYKVFMDLELAGENYQLAVNNNLVYELSL